MKPYLLVAGDFVRTGGMDQANYAMARYLAEQGHEVHLVAHRVAPDLEALANVTTHLAPKIAGSYWLSEPALDRIGRRWAERIAARGGRVLVNGGNCQCSAGNWVHYVHAMHAPRIEGRRWRRWKARLSHISAIAAERRALRQARVILCNSHGTRRAAIERAGAAEIRTHVVYYGADETRFGPVTSEERRASRAELARGDEALVFFIGALGDRRKGFHTLFEAWRRLCADPAWDAALVAIGAGAELPSWERKAREAGIGARIRFLGFRDDVPKLMAGCDLLAHPALYEAYGLGVQEALCRGVPALVSRDAGIAERYPAALRDLLIDDPEDAAALASQIRRLRENPDGLRELVAPFSAELRAHSWDAMSRRIAALLEEGN